MNYLRITDCRPEVFKRSRFGFSGNGTLRAGSKHCAIDREIVGKSRELAQMFSAL
jgi:hypothetical protein